MADLLRDFWHVILSALVGLVFIIRLEGKTKTHDVEIKALKTQRDADQQEARRSREETHQMLRDMNAKLDRLIERNMK